MGEGVLILPSTARACKRNALGERVVWFVQESCPVAAEQSVSSYWRRYLFIYGVGKSKDLKRILDDFYTPPVCFFFQ